MYSKIFHISIKELRICAKKSSVRRLCYPKSLLGISAHVRKKTSTSLLRICVYAQIIQCWKTLLSEIIIRNFCACTQKSSTSLLRICAYAQKIQCWRTLLSEIIIRNFCACTQKSSTSLLRICVYAQKIQQMIIIKISNNPIVDVLRPAQKLQVWNTYIYSNKKETSDFHVTVSFDPVKMLQQK